MQRFGISCFGAVLCAASVWLSGCAHDRARTAQSTCPSGHCESGVCESGACDSRTGQTAATVSSPPRVRNISELMYDGAPGNPRSSSSSYPSYGDSSTHSYGGSGSR
ncbi:hypothetical protein GC176_12130 [bacterium]|nr:hypothetical protein [bacterium]